MGAWGEGIYDDDEACDVRDTIRLLTSMPASGDRIVEILLAEYKRDTNLMNDGCPTFWIVVADQFERRGISCSLAFDLALKAIESGADIEDLRARDMDEKGLRKRAEITAQLLPRLRSPRHTRTAQRPRKPPRNCVSAGEIYSFPTMDGEGFNAWFSNWAQGRFTPNGWGALIITETGRVFDWFPYCAYTPLVVPPNVKPNLDTALNSRTLFSNGVSFCLPKSLHLKKMQMELLGKITVSEKMAAKMASLSDSSSKRAVICGWSICSGALGTRQTATGYFEVKEIQES